MIKYDKLVRDNVPKIIEEKGEFCKFHIATEDEYKTKLHEKLLEEIHELLENPSANEFVDVQDVLECVRKLHNIKQIDIRNTGIEKRCHNGKFDKKIILDSVV
jgi:predicted house-cleaning noncanonical NTP pyrophosphatase (MazG superfamily)